MDNTSYSREDLEYWKNTLWNYFYLKREEQRLIQRMMEEDDTRTYLKGNAYDTGGGSGCSVTVSKSDIDSATMKNIEIELDLERIKKSYKYLDATNQLSKRMKEMDEDTKTLLYAVFKREMNANDIAKKKNVSPQAVRKKIDQAIIKYMEAI